MAAAALDPEIFGKGFRFQPTPEDAVTYYLPRLLAGAPLHDAVRPVIYHADVYASAPGDLARHFRPLPRTRDRFFFSPRRGAAAQQDGRGGSWHAQSTADIKARRRGGDAKVGVLRKLRYRSRGVYTDWLMDEYGDGEEESQFVLCRMYVSPRAAPTSAAREESAACFVTRRMPPPAAVVMQLPTPLPEPPQQVPPLQPTPPVARGACDVPVQSKQRTILGPFEAAMLRDDAEEQAVPAAPHPPPPPAALQDEDDWDDLDKALEFEE